MIKVDEYFKLPLMVLPLKLKEGFVVEELKGQCPNCGGFVEDLKGKVVDHSSCSEVGFAGVCRACNLLVNCRFRYYKGGRVIQSLGTGWVEMGSSILHKNFWGLCRYYVRKFLELWNKDAQ
jgi:hypothetical protein